MGTIYYGKGDKNSIMSWIATQILAISGVNFVDYQRAYDSSVTPEHMPGAFVNDVTEDKRQMLKDVVKNTFTVGVVGWTRAGFEIDGVTPENLWKKMNVFVEAIKAKIRADSSLGNQAYNTVIAKVRTDAGSRYPVGLFAMILTVTYFSTS